MEFLSIVIDGNVEFLFEEPYILNFPSNLTAINVFLLPALTIYVK